MGSKPHIVVILGPTASGKSDLAVALARKLNGEVISADSRQVYTGLDIGTGKITKKEMCGVKHHLLDVALPKTRFTVDKYQKLAYEAIDDILSRGKLPIICGGTGFYIQSIEDGIVLPDVQPNKILREKLGRLRTEKLFEKLVKIDPKRAKMLDCRNRLRVIRAIEIASELGGTKVLKKNPKYECLQIGINFSDKILKTRIEKRLRKRMKGGMVEEASRLHKSGLSWKRMEELGLEYRNLALFLQHKITKEQMCENIIRESMRYAKKQMQWFRRDQRVWWMEVK